MQEKFRKDGRRFPNWRQLFIKMEGIDSISSAQVTILATQWFYKMYRETAKTDPVVERMIADEKERYSTARQYLEAGGISVDNLPKKLEETA